MPAPFAIPARCSTCAWLRGCVPVWWLGFAAVAGGMSLVWCGSCSTSLSICPGGVGCLRWWLGGNCYHRRCLAACRRRVGGLWL